MKAIIWDFSGTLYDTKTNKFYLGAKYILRKASYKYKQAMVTTKLSDPEGRKKLLKDIGIWKYFQIVEISLKTEEIFLSICKRFHSKPKDVFVIGDGFSMGLLPKEIMTGNRLNMKTIWVDYKKISKIKEKILGIKYWKKINNLKELDDIIF